MRKHDQSSAAAEGARRRPERPPRVTGRGGFRPGVNARRCSASCGVRISSRCRRGVGHHGGAGLAVAR